MTLQQLRYVTTVAETGTMSEAARRLFVSQPGLTKAIRELEQEMGIIIFDRTNKGIEVSKDGAIFLGYARQVLEQASLLEERYKLQAGGKKEFSVSTQHYSFAVNAFVDLIKEFGGDNYDFSLRETQTYEIIDDVAKMRSEIGILYLNDFNRTVLKKIIKANDRATMLNLMVGLNGYTLCSGIICEELNGSDYLAIPFEGDEQNQNSDMEIGYITRKNSILSKMGKLYVSSLQKYLEQNAISE